MRGRSDANAGLCGISVNASTHARLHPGQNNNSGTGATDADLPTSNQVEIPSDEWLCYQQSNNVSETVQILTFKRINRRHHTADNSSARFVGGMWSAMKPLLFKSCRFPHWWQPKRLPICWMRRLWLSLATGELEIMELRNMLLVLAYAPSAILLDGNVVLNKPPSKIV